MTVERLAKFFLGAVASESHRPYYFLLSAEKSFLFDISRLKKYVYGSLRKSNYNKVDKNYYFHNCIYSKVYKDAECELGNWVDLDYLFRHTDKDYKVIIVGDAQMAPEELFDVNGKYRGPNDGRSGYEWNKLFRSKYKKAVWLNPRYHGKLNDLSWMESERTLSEIYNMYPLTVDGLKSAINKLIAPR